MISIKRNILIAELFVIPEQPNHTHTSLQIIVIVVNYYLQKTTAIQGGLNSDEK